MSDHFSNIKEGDLVRFPLECDRDADNVDSGCGCRRSMSSFSAGATTTFKVADMDITKEEYFQKCVARDPEYATLKKGDFGEDLVYYESILQDYEEEVKDLLESANIFPVGMVLEKRGNDIQPRPSFSWTRKFRNDEE